MSNAFDLSTIESVDTVEMTVNHPGTGKPTGWKLTIAGPTHAVTQAITREVEAENDRKRQRIEQARVNGRKFKADEDGDALRDALNERLSRRILGWTPVTMDEQPFPFSPANAKALLTNPRWQVVAAQYLEFLGDEASFTKGSATA